MDLLRATGVHPEWQGLHDAITELLDRHGTKNAFRDGDYWLLDEDWGWYRQDVEFNNIGMLRVEIIKALQSLLARYPSWGIKVALDIPGTEASWPTMGLMIFQDRVVDYLDRAFLPVEMANENFGISPAEEEKILECLEREGLIKRISP